MVRQTNWRPSGRVHMKWLPLRISLRIGSLSSSCGHGAKTPVLARRGRLGVANHRGICARPPMSVRVSCCMPFSVWFGAAGPSDSGARPSGFPRTSEAFVLAASPPSSIAHCRGNARRNVGQGGGFVKVGCLTFTDTPLKALSAAPRSDVRYRARPMATYSADWRQACGEAGAGKTPRGERP